MCNQDDANAVEFALNLRQFDCAAADNARSASSPMGLGRAIEHWQSVVGQPGPYLQSEVIIRRRRSHWGLLALFFAAALAWAARATRRFARFFSRVFARASDSFLALSRRRVTNAASAASIFWIRANILALSAMVRVDA